MSFYSSDRPPAARACAVPPCLSVPDGEHGRAAHLAGLHNLRLDVEALQSRVDQVRTVGASPLLLAPLGKEASGREHLRQLKFSACTFPAEVDWLFTRGGHGYTWDTEHQTADVSPRLAVCQ